MATAPPLPSWAIIHTAPRVSADLPDGADVTLAFTAPSRRLASLTVSTRVSPADPDPTARIRSPDVLAADPSADIWADDTYKAAGLPEKEPAVALIHPINPDILYFLLDGYLFGVDVPARKVVECEAHGMAQDRVSSSSFLACKLPPARTAAAAAVAAGFGGNDAANASNDESTKAAST